jgi:hypothetical protein
LEEGRVVRAGAERADAQVCALARVAPFARVAFEYPKRAHTLVHRDFLLRVGNVARDLVHELLKGV